MSQENQSDLKSCAFNGLNASIMFSNSGNISLISFSDSDKNAIEAIIKLYKRLPHDFSLAFDRQSRNIHVLQIENDALSDISEKLVKIISNYQGFTKINSQIIEGQDQQAEPSQTQFKIFSIIVTGVHRE